MQVSPDRWLRLISCTAALPLTLAAQTSYEPYSFKTLAGAPTTAISSVDGSCKDACFGSPYGIDFDTSGNLYVADSTNHTIRKITPDCIVTTLAGSAGQSGAVDGIGADARFSFPHGVAVGPDDNIYIADAGNCNIRKVTPGGVVTTVAGRLSCGYQDGKVTDALFRAPDGLAVDANGTIWLGDTSNHVIRKITADGNVITFAGEPGVSGSNDGIGTAAHFNQTADLRLDNAGNLYVADRDNHTIRKVTPDAHVTTVAGLAGVAGSTDGSGSAARFSYPQAVAVDSSGDVFVADTMNAIVRKISRAGLVTTVGGMPGIAEYADGVGSAVRFNFLRGIAVRPDGTLYVGDSRNRAIRLGLIASQPVNLSTRVQISGGDKVTIGGFIITGAQKKEVLLRALGPSLSYSGLAPVLTDPILELYDSKGELILSNDNWREGQRSEIEATGIPPRDDREAAIIAMLPAGSYTAIERSNSSSRGTSLIEVYDVSSTDGSQLANISTRGFAGTGDNVMISGFILGNHNGGSRVLVRALGPSLANLGVTDALADPMLELHDGNGAVLTRNDNWKDADQANIEGTGIPPGNDLEPAVVATLPAGAYTAVVTGTKSTSGTALAEIYNLP